MSKRKPGEMDLSCFLLKEEIGDSDSGTGDGCQKMLMEVDADVDDAESCNDSEQVLVDDHQLESSQEAGGECCDYGMVMLMSWSCWFGDHLARRCLCSYCNFSAAAAAEEGGEECCTRHGMEVTRQSMDKMEDRLFWETCLAFGYP